MLEKLMTLYPNADDGKMEILLESCESAFRAVCNRDDVPEAAQGVIMDMVAFRYSRLNAEGLSAQNFSGMSESYLGDWPEQLKRAMYRFRKIRTL